MIIMKPYVVAASINFIVNVSFFWVHAPTTLQPIIIHLKQNYANHSLITYFDKTNKHKTKTNFPILIFLI